MAFSLFESALLTGLYHISHTNILSEVRFSNPILSELDQVKRIQYKVNDILCKWQVKHLIPYASMWNAYRMFLISKYNGPKITEQVWGQLSIKISLNDLKLLIERVSSEDLPIPERPALVMIMLHGKIWNQESLNILIHFEQTPRLRKMIFSLLDPSIICNAAIWLNPTDVEFHIAVRRCSVNTLSNLIYNKRLKQKTLICVIGRLPIKLVVRYVLNINLPENLLRLVIARIVRTGIYDTNRIEIFRLFDSYPNAIFYLLERVPRYNYIDIANKYKFYFNNDAWKWIFNHCFPRHLRKLVTIVKINNFLTVCLSRIVFKRCHIRMLSYFLVEFNDINTIYASE